jgi:hypothetical protein
VSTVLNLRPRHVRSVPCNKSSTPRRAISAWWQPRFFRCAHTLPKLQTPSWQHPIFFSGELILNGMVQVQFAAPTLPYCISRSLPPFITRSPSLASASPCLRALLSASAICTRLQALWPRLAPASAYVMDGRRLSIWRLIYEYYLRLRFTIYDYLRRKIHVHAHLISFGLDFEQHCSRYWPLTSRL